MAKEYIFEIKQSLLVLENHSKIYFSCKTIVHFYKQIYKIILVNLESILFILNFILTEKSHILKLKNPP